MFENLSNIEQEQYLTFIYNLYFYGRKSNIPPYHDTIEIMKEKVGENVCFNILDALKNDEIIQILPNGVTALTEKGIKLAEQKFIKKG